MNNIRKNPWLGLAAIGLLTVMENIDASIVNIAMPIISKSLHVPLSHTAYISIIYMVVLSGLLISFGRLGDIVGKTKVFKSGTYVFILGSLMASFNLGFEFLLLARVVQSIGAAATLSNSYGIISQIFSPDQRGRAMGINTIFISAGYVAGPALGGILLQVFPWNSIFMINIPIGIIAIIMSWLFLNLDDEATKSGKFKYDYAGSALLFISISLFFTALELAQSLGFENLMVIGLFVGFAIVAIAFWIVEQDVDAPTLDFSLFKNPIYSTALFVGALSPIVNSLFSFIFPIYLQSFRGISVGITGALVLISPITTAIAAPIGGWIGDKTSKEIMIMSGLAFMFLAQVGYYFFDQNTAISYIIVMIILNGIGTGIFIAPNTATIMSPIAKDKLGVAGASQTLAVNLGNIIGISLASLVIFTTMSHLAGYKVSSYLPSHPEWFIYGTRLTFIVAAGLMLLGDRDNGVESVEEDGS
ncbi:MFS transporter [Lentilactobacillus curieae]|uniref:MFS transporter n=1 Tax=Lentilactobacillus curieae TaxID=1138822 RepID=UPI00068D2B81|nr:MFS transporter [Lentilactobacillus curieae]